MNPINLIYYPESINPYSDIFKYKREWDGLQAYTKDKDGWFIDLAFWHPDNRPLPQEDVEILKAETGFDGGLKLKETVDVIDGRHMYGFSQFLPERPRLVYYDMFSPFNASETRKYLMPVFQAIINLDVEKAREPQDKDLPEHMMLVKLHKKRSMLGYATGSQRVESLRWLHSHWMQVVEYGLMETHVNQ